MSEPTGPTSPANRAGRSAEPIPEQGRHLKVPYDWREPTPEKVAARMWNPDDRRLFTPKALGWGYDFNFYWLVHPVRFLRRR